MVVEAGKAAGAATRFLDAVAAHRHFERDSEPPEV